MARPLAKNDIPFLILAILEDAPRHGYGIAREVERRSEGLFDLKEGSLYPALRVLEQDELIEGNWEIQGSGPARKVYRITGAGKAELAKKAKDWSAYRKAIEQFMAGGAYEPAT